MGRYIQRGETVRLAAPYARSAWQMAKIGSLIAVATVNAAEAEQIEFALEGVFELTKVGSEAWSVGDKVYWDDSNKRLTKTAAGNTFAGVAIFAVGSGAGETLGIIKLVGPDSNQSLLQAANVAALAGTLTGTVTGTMADISALSTSDTYSDAAVNAKITEINLQLKELQTKINAILTAEKASGQMVADA